VDKQLSTDQQSMASAYLSDDTLCSDFFWNQKFITVPISSPRKYTEHTTESYTKFQALVQAIRNCSELIENKDKTEISRALQDIVSPSDRSRIIQ